MASAPVWGHSWAAQFVRSQLCSSSRGDAIGQNLSLLAQFFPGYNGTWAGSLIGLLYGFVIGFLFGFSFAFSGNTAMRLHLGSRKVQRFLKRARQRQAST